MRTQGFCALAPQPVGPSGQLGKERTLPDAEDLFSLYGVGPGQLDSAPHAGTCSVGVELREYVQEQDAAPLKQFQGSRFKVLLFVTYSIIQNIISSEM